MYTSEQRHQLEKEFVVRLAAYENWEVDPSTIHLAAETNPRVKRWLELSRKLLDVVEQAIS
ncbi:hypothetical protein [Nostoc sp. UIC 10630]|uniref:hypothetical protein n=1 Tax=Nostoc sp. UIC 10630 TaxID=2100146 RepID=UPI0013D7C05B|nr:hypothetical protein [Nostoc sp. UIC 10630]NEU77618.1 hypothetical protein [Nostoc sp. UIC 10630]